MCPAPKVICILRTLYIRKMNILSLQNVTKRYHNHTAVDDVTFDVPKGKIFGFLGPNGAGKTSLIRIITGITMAEEGTILIDGEKLSSHHPSQIGYMPEERGLYKKMKVGDHLMYLAQLRGMDKKNAKTSISEWIEKFEIESWWNKKIEELSKGMQQKIQFIATVMHNPKLLILDEPFSGLDPINSNLIKDEIYQINKKGTSIIFSTHRMEQVEEICEEIILINNGKLILEGNVAQIKEKYKEHKYLVKYTGESNINLPPTIKLISKSHDYLTIQSESAPVEIMKALINNGVNIIAFNEILPSINDIFIKQVEESVQLS